MMQKDSGDKAIVVEVGLAVIAVVLLVFFRDAMEAFISDLVSSVTSKLNEYLSISTIF